MDTVTVTSSERDYKRKSNKRKTVEFTFEEFENFKSDMMYQ